MTVFDTHLPSPVSATAQHYHPVMSLPDGELVAMRPVAGLPRHDLRRRAHGRAGHPRTQCQTAMAEAAAWPDRIGLWLALPWHELDNQDFPMQLRIMLRQAGLAADRTSLELPEADAIGVTPDGLLLLSALRDAGIGLNLVEFGGAIASLSMLRRLPLTAMTLSPALVRGLPADREDASLTGAAIAMAHTLGLAVIADGIANAAQREWLAGRGCLAGLGPMFGPPRMAGRLG